MTVQPTGPGLMLLIVMSVCLALTTIVVALRICARLMVKAFGLDDWLMILGWACLTFVFISDFIFIYHGVGAHSDRISPSDRKIAQKWFLLAGIGYAITTAPIKASICVLLLRITANTRSLYTWILYGNIFLACVGTLVRVVAYTVRCKPFAAAWDPELGTCASPTLLTNTSYFFGATCILTDGICAVLPTLVVWHMRLERRIKWYIGVILALGFLASIATITRMRYLTSYNDPSDTLYNLVPIALWSEMECTLGIMAGSLATLRPLLRYLPAPLASSLTARATPPLALREFCHPWNPHAAGARHGAMGPNLNTPSASLSRSRSRSGRGLGMGLGLDSTASSNPMARYVAKRRERREREDAITYMGHSFHVNGGGGGSDGGHDDDAGSMRRMLDGGEAGSEGTSIGMEIVKETSVQVVSERERWR